MRVLHKQGRQSGGFTLLELLMVLAVLSILTALLLAALVGAKAKARMLACQNQLRQTGIALRMYVSDSGVYPPEADRNDSGSRVLWADRLYPNLPRAWTNAVWQCPAYVARQGLIRIFETNDVCTSYAFNEWGMVATSRSARLGLGLGPNSGVRDSDVAAPSEMFAIGDSRTFEREFVPYMGWLEPLHGLMQMQAFRTYKTETAPLHPKGYDMLFGDGHVAPVSRRDYLYPPLASRHWNRDNKPHPEAWEPRIEWAEKK
jgi:prepilin-type N-terminal cleavage/methylation domain-containing protein/prepilin-type processing-associated H-X9-DG protein